MPDLAFVTLVIIIILGLGFDYINGFHDTANAIATSVATRVLTPGRAVLMAAGPQLHRRADRHDRRQDGRQRDRPTGRGDATAGDRRADLGDHLEPDHLVLRDPIEFEPRADLLDRRRGAGRSAGRARSSLAALTKTFQGLGLSPLLGFGGAFAADGRSRSGSSPAPAHASSPPLFGRLQIVSAAYMAFSHGGNDAQKTMGVITMALASYYGWTGDEWRVPFWVVASAATAMALGTALGGWRIVRTMGLKVVELRPIHGFAAETAAATVIEVCQPPRVSPSRPRTSSPARSSASARRSASRRSAGGSPGGSSPPGSSPSPSAPPSAGWSTP